MSDCEFEHPHDEHPCGQKPEAPGTPCRYCGEPVPMDGSACPDCWIDVADIPFADLKAAFANVDLSLGVPTRGDA